MLLSIFLTYKEDFVLCEKEKVSVILVNCSLLSFPNDKEVMEKDRL